MTGTEQKILDAALKVFARKGFDAATTRAIAEESGFTEMTLFRKFNTKKNLFEQVMMRGDEQIREHSFQELFIPKEYKNTRDFLEEYVSNLDTFLSENFEYFHLSVIEENRTKKPIFKTTLDVVSEYLEKNVPHQKLDYQTFGLAISTFLYSLNIDRYHGRVASFGDYEKSKDKLVDILFCMVKN